MKYKETILWAVKVGDEDWQEQIITTDESKIEEASNWAKENGYDRLRVAVIDLGVKPDFPSTINKFEMGGLIDEIIFSPDASSPKTSKPLMMSVSLKIVFFEESLVLSNINLILCKSISLNLNDLFLLADSA